MSLITTLKEALMFVLKVATGPIIRQVKRLNAQRKAASGVVSPPTNRIEICLSETINALTGRAAQPAWWRNAIATAQQASIRPDPQFFGESLWKWLDDPKVRQCLSSLAANDLSGRPRLPADDQNRQALASKYEELVGDKGTLASGIVEVILAVLIAGLQADLATNPSAQALSAQNQASTEIILAKLDGVTISKKVDSSEGPTAGQDLEAAALRRIAGNLLAAGSPPSLLPLFPTASAAARKALEEFGNVRRRITSSTEQASSAKQEVHGISALTEMGELHHLLIAPPGSGKTYALWHAANEMLNTGGLIPLFLPLGRLASWDDVIRAVADVADGVSIDTLVRDSRVCVFLDGWSEFVADYGVNERARVLRVLSRTRVVANGRHGMAVDAVFRLWVLDPPSVSEVEKAIKKAFPGSLPPEAALIELLRLPLALSLFILLGGSVSTRGELLIRLHEHLSNDPHVSPHFEAAGAI
ncbi:hypothetical protein [Acidiphilium iwatense]|uniref:Uncharacterized protein n=1 Tax=Acidiphilium iwatense TaxID=768198 RepID=A0ABS9E1Q2_9PROT|nr:hypothetical protein [Acidiphilium iwatense]MCF3948849.1 hypothetical protein [Acidiphilium iwatense]